MTVDTADYLRYNLGMKLLRVDKTALVGALGIIVIQFFVILFLAEVNHWYEWPLSLAAVFLFFYISFTLIGKIPGFK